MCMTDLKYMKCMTCDQIFESQQVRSSLENWNGLTLGRS